MLVLIGLLLLLDLGHSEGGALPVLSSGAGQSAIVTLSVPAVVSTTPSSGAVVEPGPFELSVSFDTAMQAGSYSFVRSSGEAFPTCDTRPALSSDRRTFTLRCEALPDTQYEVWFNRPPYMNFKSERGVPATPSRLLFRTHRR